MAQIVKCPSCGASDYEKKDDIHYRCNFCESTFVIEEKKRQTNINDFIRQYSGKANYTPVTTAKTVRAVMFGVVFFILALGIGIAVFVSSVVQEATVSGPGQVAKTGNWGDGSINKFQIFEGSKGAVIWILVNQSTTKLDSSRYTLQLVDPIRNKVITEKKYMDMTWKESFNFNNYLSEMLCFRNEVYFLSDANGLAVYDLYTGKMKMDSEQFAKKFPELKSGLVSAKNKYYKNALELMTKDGFKYNYLPQYDLLVSEEQFNDYQKGSGLIGGFVCSDPPRQKLYYIISNQDTLRSDFSFSEYYLTQYLRNGKSGNHKEKAYEVDSSKVFFNVKYILRNNNQIVFAYTENVDKKSKAYIISYIKSDFTKPAWKIDFANVPGFEKAMSEDYYLRTHFSEKEVAVWYESAQKIGFGLDLKSGKINWKYTIN